MDMTRNDLMKKRTTNKKRRKVCRNSDWSKLCPDVLRKIFETLSRPIDYHQAKTVCSDWYSVWKTCTNMRMRPWRIIHQGDFSTSRKGRSYCMASSGNWLLMVDVHLKFYITNIVTQKRINLPSMESPIRGGLVRFIPNNIYNFGYFVGNSRTSFVSYDTDGLQNSTAVLWINETTGDYVVAWIFRQHYLFSHKKGDDSWCNRNLINRRGLCFLDMAFENNKVYLFTADHHIKIFDYSGDFLKEKITENPYRNHPFCFVKQEWESIWKTKIAIQKSGEVLIILSLKEVLHEERILFYIFKMNLESGKWERVYSIGDEMLIFGHGVTIAPSLKDLDDGIKSDSIYFVDNDVWPQDRDHRDSECGVFDIATSRIEWPRKKCISITV